MKWISTRGKANLVSTLEAISLGLAPDGGLFVPEKMPQGVVPYQRDIAEFAVDFLKPFFEGEKCDLSGICQRAFNFEIPIKNLIGGPAVLELFHGPTNAFKDFAARFLAELLGSISQSPRTVLVATSGDTGGAVASAFSGKDNFRVVILFPKGRISDRQFKQLTSFGGNIHAFAVDGTFDDCQALVKKAFVDPRFQKFNLLSANSINIARILPQAIYYAHTSLLEKDCTFIIPTGNLGNAVAALWAKKMGYPIRKIVFSCNQNQTLPDYFKTGTFSPGKTVHTLANAMDVSAPSNFERLQSLYPILDLLKKDCEIYSSSDDEIRAALKDTYQAYDYTVCPHTATAFSAFDKRGRLPAILVSTAHPAKFESIVEPILGIKLDIPRGLSEILSRPSHFTDLDGSFEDFFQKMKVD